MRDIVEGATYNGVHCSFIPTVYGPISIGRDAGAVYARPSSGSLFERSRAYSVYVFARVKTQGKMGEAGATHWQKDDTTPSNRRPSLA